LICDVPLGAFLSGGLDSSIVVAEAQALLGQQLHTFSIGFAGGGWYDESSYAELVAKQLGTKHQCFMVEPDAIAKLPQLLAHYDEPFLDSSALPMALLSQMTREHCTVALSGDGGDEVFAGYERFGAGAISNCRDRYAKCLSKPLPCYHKPKRAVAWPGLNGCWQKFNCRLPRAFRAG